jgi:hypothetical protein
MFPGERHMAKRVNVNFSDESYGTLERIAKKKGKTMSEVLRDAIALEAWFDDTTSSGGHILVEREGKVQEVISR